MRRTGSVLLFAAISLALHLGWVVWMPAGSAPARPREHWVEVSFEEAQPASAPAGETGAVEDEVVVEAPSRREWVAPSALSRALSSSPSPSRSPSTSTSTSAAAAAVGSAVEQQAGDALGEVAALPPSAATVPARPEKMPVISPRAAALSVGAFALGPALRCAAPGTAAPTDEPRDCAPADDKGEAAQAALARDLKAIAKRVPHLKAREAPELRRRSDGSYAYDGHVFAALVRPDGQVEFTDAAAQAQLRPSLVPFKVVADVNDLVEHNLLGRELYSAEKQWFLDQTRELRLQLSAAARRQELLAANRALERTLQDVLGDRSLSLSQKHDAVFLIWQDCGEDAQQKAHRRAVEAFVRRYMPQGSERGFRPEELERFNRGRGSLQKFEPYSSS